LEDLFLGSQWSIILGYIWLSVKFLKGEKKEEIRSQKSTNLNKQNQLKNYLTIENQFFIVHVCIVIAKSPKSKKQKKV